MGCCASSHEAPAIVDHRRSSQSPCKGGGAPPPPALVEKETVKEVLSSEIPKPKAVPASVDEDQKKTSPALVAACVVGKEIEEKAVNKIDNTAPAVAPASPSSSASLASEMYSWSESVSAPTVTDTRDGDDHDDGRSREIRRRVGRAAPKFPRNYRPSPPGGVRGRRQPGVAASSPVRRSEPSPVMGRSGSVREAGQLTSARRGVPRQELGEVSRRMRSMSPATRSGPGAGRSPSVRKTGRAPGVRSPAKATAAESSGQAVETWRMEERDDDESLENPLVSLECFIFL